MTDPAAFMSNPWFWLAYLIIVVPLFGYAAYGELKYGSPASYEQKMLKKHKVHELERGMK